MAWVDNLINLPKLIRTQLTKYMEDIIKEIGDTYFMLVHQNSKNSGLGAWYVIGVDEIKLKYPTATPVFHSETIEGCLSLLLEELRIIRK